MIDGVVGHPPVDLVDLVPIQAAHGLHRRLALGQLAAAAPWCVGRLAPGLWVVECHIPEHMRAA
jgi:hypothetical protein